jgi:hypothetical protein
VFVFGRFARHRCFVNELIACCEKELMGFDSEEEVGVFWPASNLKGGSF